MQKTYSKPWLTKLVLTTTKIRYTEFFIKQKTQEIYYISDLKITGILLQIQLK